jgi:hypothetical protein
MELKYRESIMTKYHLRGGIAFGLAMLASTPIWSADPPPPIKSVLHFTKVGYFEHVGGIKGCTDALNNLANQYKFTVKTTKDFADLANVKNYDMVIFDNNTDAGGVTNTENAAQQALKAYMNDGGRFIGIHAAADHRSQWGWYETEIFAGIKFINHTDGNFSVYKDPDGPKGNDTLTKMLAFAKDSLGLNTDVINFNTEIYHFSGDVKGKPGVTVFQQLQGATAQNKVSESFGWVKSVSNGKGGKILYTALGHETPEWTANNSWQTKMLYVYMKYMMGHFNPTPVSVKPPEIQTEGHSLRVLSPEARSVQILDVSGRVVASGSAADFTRELPKTGVYFVKVGTANGKFFSKAVTIK